MYIPAKCWSPSLDSLELFCEQHKGKPQVIPKQNEQQAWNHIRTSDYIWLHV